MKNNDITPVVAGNEEKKDFEIKRGLEISSIRQSFYYALTFLEDNLKVFENYFLDWTDWFEDKYEEEYILGLIEEGAIEDLEAFKNSGVKIEKGFCKKFIDNIYNLIRECKDCIKNNDLMLFIPKIKLLKDIINKLWQFFKIYTSHSYHNPFGDDDCGFYFLTPIIVPVRTGILNIIDIIDDIYKNIDNDYFRWDFDYNCRGEEQC